MYREKLPSVRLLCYPESHTKKFKKEVRGKALKKEGQLSI